MVFGVEVGFAVDFDFDFVGHGFHGGYSGTLTVDEVAILVEEDLMTEVEGTTTGVVAMLEFDQIGFEDTTGTSEYPGAGDGVGSGFGVGVGLGEGVGSGLGVGSGFGVLGPFPSQLIQPEGVPILN